MLLGVFLWERKVWVGGRNHIATPPAFVHTVPYHCTGTAAIKTRAMFAGGVGGVLWVRAECLSDRPPWGAALPLPLVNGARPGATVWPDARGGGMMGPQDRTCRYNHRVSIGHTQRRKGEGQKWGATTPPLASSDFDANSQHN